MNLDVTADSDGVLSKIIAQEGDVVEVGAVLGEIEAGAAAAAAPKEATGKTETPEIVEDAAPEPEKQESGHEGTTVRATPVVQRLAKSTASISMPLRALARMAALLVTM